MEKPWHQRLLIALAVTAAFGRLGAHEFTGWDDPATIFANPDFNPPRLANLARYWTAWGDRAVMGLYVPLTYTAWGLLAHVAYLDAPDPAGVRLNPFVFHTANVVLHVLGALAAFELLRPLVRRAWAACAGALLWGLHPVQVEPVGWASGTKDVLCGLLGIIALWQYVTYARAADDGAPAAKRRLPFALATLAFVGATLSKPTAVVLPAMALVIDALVLRRPLRRAVRSLALWVVLALPFAYVAKLTQTTLGMDAGPLWRRALVAADALAFYLCKLAWPLDLGMDYGRTPARAAAEGWLLYTWLAPAAVAVLLLILWRRGARVPAAAALLLVAGVSPVLGFLPFQFQFYSTVADHYLYLAMVGPALALAWLADRWPKPTVALACAAVLAALGVRSFDQGRYWYDDLTLFTRAIEVNPRSFVAHNNIGSALWRRGQYPAAAEHHFRRAIAIWPDYPSGHDNLALVLIYTGRPEESVDHIAHVLRVYHDLPAAVRPHIEQTHAMFGEYLLSRGRAAEAAEQFRAALKVNPNHAPASDGLARATTVPVGGAATVPSTQGSK